MSPVRLALEHDNGTEASALDILRDYKDQALELSSRRVAAWKVVLCTALATAILAFLPSATRHVRALQNRPIGYASLFATTDVHDDLERTIQLLYHPILHGFDGPFHTANGKVFSTPSSHWNTALGTDLCIVNVDSRPMNQSNQVWATGKTHFDWSHITGSQSGYLNHYIYSRIHGYRYVYVQATVPDGYVTAWARPGVFRQFLDQCRVLVYADSDVVIPNLRLPFEWLLNRWEIPTNHSILALADEPEIPGWDLRDDKGRQGFNGGFIIMHNRGEGILDEILEKWGNCVSEVDYPGCADLKGGWPAEQGGINNYVRYDFPDYIRGLPCSEAFGWPEWDNACQGPLMRHYTMDKTLVHGGIESSLAQGFFRIVHDDMLDHKAELFRFEGHVLDGHDGNQN